MQVKTEDNLEILWKEIVLQCDLPFTKRIDIGSKKRRMVIKEINKRFLEFVKKDKTIVRVTTLN